MGWRCEICGGKLPTKEYQRMTYDVKENERCIISDTKPDLGDRVFGAKCICDNCYEDLEGNIRNKIIEEIDNYIEWANMEKQKEFKKYLNNIKSIDEAKKMTRNLKVAMLDGKPFSTITDEEEWIICHKVQGIRHNLIRLAQQEESKR